MSVKPRVVKQIIDSTTKEISDVPVQKDEQVISKETSEKVLSMMESVVSEGTGKNTPKLNPKAIAHTQHMDIHRFIYLPPISLYLGFPI